MLEALLSMFLVVFGFTMPTPISVVPTDVGFLVTHEDGKLTELAPLDSEGIILASFGRAPNDQSPQQPVPTLQTSWTDANGVTHTVTTPIPSTTPAGLQAATALHTNLVQIMQTRYPPRLPPP
jgi:hypothetical protein